MQVRPARKNDIVDWSRFRTCLWPDTSDNHRSEIDDYFADRAIDIRQVLVAETDAGTVVGFIELNVRNFAEGSRQPAVPYVEGWYVDEPYRNAGYGQALMAAAESWALAQGFHELASDAELTNTASIQIHKRLGFEETDRVVCFLKKLTQP